MIETKLDGKTKDIVSENISKMKDLFPEVFQEDTIDFDKLKQLLNGGGGKYGVNADDERYNFTWKGKTESIQIAQTPSTGTLRPCKEESKNWDTTQNLYIEGDNLEVLKLLQKSYSGKIKMIYIDPPYNTGKDFIYKDNYRDNLENYIEQDENGFKTSSDPETSGRYHSIWLNMMYPRLKLAKNLLTEDGSIYINIDFNEVSNLKKIMDEIFGENNFQREIIWRIGWLSGYKTLAHNFIRNHDTILFYSKNSQKLSFNKKYIENSHFKPIVKKEKNIISKLNEFGLSKIEQDDLLNFINHENRPSKYPIEDTWNSNEYDNLNSIAIVSFSGEKISKILNIKQDFKGQKSIQMLNRLLEASTNSDDFILDFFSGTASTAHSIIQFNSKENSNRKYIMVQLPEQTDEKSEAYKAGFSNICEIGKERIRRAGDKIIEETGNSDLDIGFKVFKLDSSNIMKWNPDYNNLKNNLLAQTDNLVDGRSNLDLVYEIMLKYGIDITLPIDEYENDDYKLYSVGAGALIICLDDMITKDVANSIVDLKNELNPFVSRVVLKDSGFVSDADKVNVREILKNNEVEEFITI